MKRGFETKTGTGTFIRLCKGNVNEWSQIHFQIEDQIFRWRRRGANGQFVSGFPGSFTDRRAWAGESEWNLKWTALDFLESWERQKELFVIFKTLVLDFWDGHQGMKCQIWRNINITEDRPGPQSLTQLYYTILLYYYSDIIIEVYWILCGNGLRGVTRIRKKTEHIWRKKRNNQDVEKW